MNSRRVFFKKILTSVLIAPIIVRESCRPNLIRAIRKRQTVAEFSKWIFPIIKEINYCNVIEQLIEVQPMQVPSSQVFYIDYRKRNLWQRLKDSLKRLS